MSEPSGGRTLPGNPHPVDVYVGLRVRERRIIIGMSQQKLGDRIGLTFQQVQKYERGTNRMGASRLFDISRVLGVPIQFFFEGYQAAEPATAGMSEGPAASYEAPKMKRESLDLARLIQRVDDPTLRRRLVDLARSLAEAYSHG